jgi:hypothetical protein
VKTRAKKTTFLATIITLIILLTGAIAVPACAEEELPVDNVSNIDVPNVLLVGRYGFDLSDSKNNNYNLGTFMEVAQTAYKNTETNLYEVYWFSGSKWYDLVSDEFLSNPIGNLDSI